MLRVCPIRTCWFSDIIYYSYCELMPHLLHCFIKNLLRNIRVCFSMLERGFLNIKNLIFVFLHIEILLANQTDPMTIRPTFLSGLKQRLNPHFLASAEGKF